MGICQRSAQMGGGKGVHLVNCGSSVPVNPHLVEAYKPTRLTMRWVLVVNLQCLYLVLGTGGKHVVWAGSDEVSEVLALFRYKDGLHRVCNYRKILIFEQEPQKDSWGWTDSLNWCHCVKTSVSRWVDSLFIWIFPFCCQKQSHNMIRRLCTLQIRTLWEFDGKFLVPDTAEHMPNFIRNRAVCLQLWTGIPPSWMLKFSPSESSFSNFCSLSFQLHSSQNH